MSVLAGLLVWTPFVIVVLKVLFDIDAYSSPGVPWLAANVVFSVAVIALAIFLAKTFGNRISGSPILQRFLKDLAGYNVNEAAGFLATLAEFDAEDAKLDRADLKLADDRSDSRAHRLIHGKRDFKLLFPFPPALAALGSCRDFSAAKVPWHRIVWIRACT